MQNEKNENDLSLELQLEKAKQETLQMQIDLAKLQQPMNPNDKREQALIEFDSLSPEEKMERIQLRESSAKPATEHFPRTVWYLKPVIQSGKLTGTKVAVLVFAGQPVAKEDIPYIEDVEAKHEKLNKIYRKQAEAQHKKYTGRDEKIWMMEKPIQTVQEVKKNEGISVG